MYGIAAVQPLTSKQKQLISQLSPTLENKVIFVSERGLTSTQWSVYNTDTNRVRYSSVPTSSITAEAVTVDGFAVSQKDVYGIVTTATRCYSYDTLGRPLTRTISRNEQSITDTFGYNTRSELTSAQVNNAAYTYDYGNIGNRNWGDSPS